MYNNFTLKDLHRCKQQTSACTCSGFTIIELVIVLIVIGLITAFAVGAWLSLLQSKKFVNTDTILRQTRNCLLSRMSYTLQYPTYTPGLKCSNQTEYSRDVDYCLCKNQNSDAWGNRLRFLEGINSTGAPLHGHNAAQSEPRGMVFHSPGRNSSIINPQNETIREVAFVIISFGPDGEADHDSYGHYFHNSLANSTQSGEKPNFNEAENDVISVVTGNAIRSWFSE